MTILLVTDLDGSLWGPDLECHPETIRAMAELTKQKVPVLVATGRRETSARDGLRKNGLSFPAVLLNGSLGIELDTGQRFHEDGFTPEHAWQVIDLLGSVNISPLIYTSDGRVRHDGKPTTAAGHLSSVDVDYRPGPPSDSDVVVGFSMLGIEHDLLVAGMEVLVGSSVAQATFYEDHLYNGWSLMVQPAGISKQVGIEAYVAYSGLEPDQVIAVGDGGNDLEMLAGADMAIGCAGGDERALALADVIVPHPDDGGWAQVLQIVLENAAMRR